jgi:Ca-activated chloride channel family protein
MIQKRIITLSIAIFACFAVADAQSKSSDGFFGFLKSGFGLLTSSNEKEMRRNVRHGNKMMKAGERDKAFGFYRKAYEADRLNPLVNYNLGTAMFSDEWKIMPTDTTRDKAMISHFTVAAGNEQNRINRAASFHNAGVLYQTRANQSKDQNKKYQYLMQAIEEYKNALRNNPHDDEARYNMVLCQKQLPKGGGGGGNNDQQQNNDEEQKNDEQQKDENQPQQPKEEPQKQQQQNQDWVEQMLNAAEQREKQVRNKIDEYQQKSSQQRPRRNMKNW